MATDVYIKFGTIDETIGPRDTPRPQIDGDSTDDLHYWWCEARSCGFDLEAKDPEPVPAEDGATKPEDKEKSKSKFKPITLKKRVDWASTQLFNLCCDQAVALSKSKVEQEKSWLNEVTIEVCRPGPGDKIPFVAVVYGGVRLTHYSIDLSTPEPSESITFEFQEIEFYHTRIDPLTGRVPDTGAETYSGLLQNLGTGQSGIGQGTSASPPGSSTPAPQVPVSGGGGGATAPVGAGGTGNPGANGAPAGPGSDNGVVNNGAVQSVFD